MASSSAQQHWETVYATKQPHQVSWTQPVPATSMEFIRSFPLDKQARIIDVGGGDSQLVDFLLAEGYEHITVLDISATALAKARRRLGPRARRVNWVVSDVLTFRPTTTFDVWHDRATFHFLTTPAQIAHYLALAQAAIRPHGYLTIGTFSPAGPAQCSGLPVQQYSEQELTGTLAQGFAKIRCRTEDHRTPFQTLQNFLFCSFQRRLSPRAAPPAVAGASQLAPAFLSKTVLYIKHMVCPRGVRVVRQELESLGLRVLDVRLGAATVEGLGAELDWARIRQALATAGFALLEDPHHALAARVKQAVAALLQRPGPLRHRDFIPTLARELGLDSRRLHAAFARLPGHASLIGYITEQRLAYAQELLLTSKLAVGRIARQLGYGSLAHFSGQFRRFAQCSPSAFRQRVAAGGALAAPNDASQAAIAVKPRGNQAV